MPRNVRQDEKTFNLRSKGVCSPICNDIFRTIISRSVLHISVSISPKWTKKMILRNSKISSFMICRVSETQVYGVCFVNSMAISWPLRNRSINNYLIKYLVYRLLMVSGSWLMPQGHERAPAPAPGPLPPPHQAPPGLEP